MVLDYFKNMGKKKAKIKKSQEVLINKDAYSLMSLYGSKLTKLLLNESVEYVKSQGRNLVTKDDVEAVLKRSLKIILEDFQKRYRSS